MTKRRLGIDIAVLLVIVAVVLNIDIKLADGIGYYLGPMNAILHGKTLLVDVDSQYGLLSIYALSGLFGLLHIPLSYAGFSLLNAVLYVIGYGLIYVVLRMWLRSQLVSILGITIIILQNYFIQVADPLVVPQVGFLRFGWFIPIMFVIVLRHRIKLEWLRALEVLFVGIAFFWGLDSGVYVLGAYVVFLIVEGLPSIKLIVTRMACLAVCVLTLFAAISMFTFARTYQLPDWYNFMEYGLVYNAAGVGMLSMSSMGIYLIFMVTYVVIAGYIIINLFEWGKGNPRLAIVAFMTAYGVLQFIYYVGRSHHNNLNNTVIPLVMILCWVAAKILSKYSWPDLRIQGVIVTSAVTLIISVLYLIPFPEGRGKSFDMSPYLYFPEDKRADVAESIEAIKQVDGNYVAIVSMTDTFFLVATDKTNVIKDSDNFMQLLLKSQIELETDRLLTLRPSSVFIDHDLTNTYHMFGVPMMVQELSSSYYLSRNVGYLDEWRLR